GPQLLEAVGGVLDGVVQQRRGERLHVAAELGEDGGDGGRVGDVRVAALALLAAVVVRGHLVGALKDPQGRLSMGGAYGLEERFEYRIHCATPLPREPAPSPSPGGFLLGRSGQGGQGVRLGRALALGRAVRAGPTGPVGDGGYAGYDDIAGHADSLPSSPVFPVYPLKRRRRPAAHGGPPPGRTRPRRIRRPPASAG